MAALNPRGVQAFPPDWEARHQPVAEASMTAEVELWSGVDPEWVWNGTAETRDLGDLIWCGPARIQQRNDTDLSPAGDQQVTVHKYLVALPREVGTGAWIKVVGSGDPLLGLLKVIDTQKGSVRWERDLVCTDHLG